VVAALLDLVAQARLLDPGGGPEPTGELRVSPVGFLAIMLAGFAIGTAGHALKSRAMVAFGIALIFGATVLVPVLLAVTN
jgi:hypothetical protein